MNQVESGQAAGEANRRRAVAVRASALLERALADDVPPGSAITLGCSLVFFLRQNGGRSGQFTIQAREGETP
jgi:hypothetical protein